MKSRPDPFAVLAAASAGQISVVRNHVRADLPPKFSEIVCDTRQEPYTAYDALLFYQRRDRDDRGDVLGRLGDFSHRRQPSAVLAFRFLRWVLEFAQEPTAEAFAGMDARFRTLIDDTVLAGIRPRPGDDGAPSDRYDPDVFANVFVDIYAVLEHQHPLWLDEGVYPLQNPRDHYRFLVVWAAVILACIAFMLRVVVVPIAVRFVLGAALLTPFFLDLSQVLQHKHLIGVRPLDPYAKKLWRKSANWMAWFTVLGVLIGALPLLVV